MFKHRNVGQTLLKLGIYTFSLKIGIMGMMDDNTSHSHTDVYNLPTTVKV